MTSVSPKKTKKTAPKGTSKGAKKVRSQKKKAKKAAPPPPEIEEEESPEAEYTPPAFGGPVVQEPKDEHVRALEEFFVSPDEMDAAGAMSLDLYRDEMDTRLRAEGVQEYLSFVLADESYAVNIFHIKEIIKPPMITEVPRTEKVILGVLNLRGMIAAVVDLRRRLGLEASEQTRKSRILIIQLRDELVGLLVDEVRHVIRLKDEDIEPPPGVFDRVEAEHIVGVGRQEGEMYTLLDLDSVIQIDRYLKAK
jgi:purine-binding chemotaxis protein CheW